MIFWREVLYYCTVDAAILLQHKEQHIFKWNYQITVVHEIHISRLELQRLPPEYVTSFSKVFIQDLGLRFG
jgi:hypothetical protein